MASAQRAAPTTPDYVPFEPPFRRAFYPVEDYAAPSQPVPMQDQSAFQLANSLKGLEPSINGLLGQISTAQHKQDSAQASVDYASDAKSWGDAVRDNPALASKSPYYRQAWQELHAQNSVASELAPQIGTAYQNSGIKYNSDPNAVNAWVGDQVNQWKQGLGDSANDPFFIQGLKRPLAALQAHVLAQHATDLVTYNHEQLDTQTSASIVNAITSYTGSGKGDMKELGGMINSILQTPKFAGMDPKEADALAFQAVDGVAKATKNANLYGALAVPRQDINDPSKTVPSYADTGAGLQKIQEAIQHLQASKHSDASFQWQQHEHADKMETQSIVGGLAPNIAHGQLPNLDDPRVQRLAQISPNAYNDMLRTVEARQKLSTYTPPQAVNEAMMNFYLTPTTGDQTYTQRFQKMFLQPGSPIANLSDGDFDRKLHEAMSMDQTNFYKLPEIEQFKQQLTQSGKLGGKASAFDRDPSSPQRILYDFASNGGLDWVTKNPTADPVARAKALAPLMDAAVARDKLMHPAAHEDDQSVGPITPESLAAPKDAQHSAFQIKSGVDTADVHPGLVDSLKTSSGQLGNGYTVQVSEGFNDKGHVPNSQHHNPGMGALDLSIIGPDGKPIANQGVGEDQSGMYKKLAILTYAAMVKSHPEIADKLRWGGFFETKPGSGKNDYMHFDLGGGQPQLAQLAAPFLNTSR